MAVRQILVTGMTCPACSLRVERRLQKTPGVLRAGVDLLEGTAVVEIAEDASIDAALAAVRAAGYGAALPDPEADAAHRAAADLALRRQLCTAVASLLAGCLAMTASMFCPAPFREGLRWILWGVSLLAVMLGGRQILRASLSELRSRAPGMNALASLGMAAALIFSLFASQSYADSVLFLLGFLLFGRFLEERMRLHARDSLESLSRLQPVTAHRLEESGERDCPAGLLVPGDRVRVRPGETFPADGTVETGTGSADLALVSGESEPVTLLPGSEVVAGGVNGRSALVVTVTRGGADSTLSRLAALTREARSSRTGTQRLAERFVRLFVPGVLGFAVLAAAGWIFLPPSPAWSQAALSLIAVLVAACPCAMGLAVPAAVAAAHFRAAHEGLLIREASALETLAKVDVICLDKTGTLTEGRPDVVKTVPAPGWDERDLLTLTSGAEAGSEHPLAGSVLRASGARGIVVPEAMDFRAVPGCGLEASVNGRRVRVGRLEWLTSAPPPVWILAARESAMTELVVEVDGELAGLLLVRDALRQGAPKAMRRLRAMGVRMLLLTGDTASAAAEVAEVCGLTEVHAGLRPEGKLALVRQLRQDGHVVAFVGDGLNDAPSLAGADVGLAVGTGTGAAIGAAPVTVVGGDPQRLVTAVALGRRARRFFIGNLGWAFGYNMLLLPVAAGVLAPWGLLLSPGLAALAMSLSSICVLANSLRLRRVRL